MRECRLALLDPSTSVAHRERPAREGRNGRSHSPESTRVEPECCGAASGRHRPRLPPNRGPADRPRRLERQRSLHAADLRLRLGARRCGRARAGAASAMPVAGGRETAEPASYLHQFPWPMTASCPGAAMPALARERPLQSLGALAQTTAAARSLAVLRASTPRGARLASLLRPESEAARTGPPARGSVGRCLRPRRALPELEQIHLRREVALFNDLIELLRREEAGGALMPVAHDSPESRARSRSAATCRARA